MDTQDDQDLYHMIVWNLVDQEKQSMSIQDYDCAEIVELENGGKWPRWYPDDFISNIGGHSRFFVAFAKNSRAAKKGWEWFKKNAPKHLAEFEKAVVECWVRALAWGYDSLRDSLSTQLWADEYYTEAVSYTHLTLPTKNEV